MKKIKQNNGITLVALVITIIVLLILAGITIYLMIGQDGIITRAVEAGKTQKVGEIKEKIGLDLLNADTEARIRGEKLEEQQKEDIASKYGELQADKDTLKLKDVDAEVSLKEIWNGEVSNTGNYTANKERIEELEKQVENLEKALETSINNGITVSKTKNIGVSTTNTYTFKPEDFGFKSIYGIQNVAISDQYILDTKLLNGNVEVTIRNVTSNYALDIIVTVTAIGQ